jgi:hypothetical protein
VSGIIAQYAMAGLSLHYLQFVLGLLSLGHDVYYVEDNGAPPFSPVTQNVDIDYSYNLPHIRGLMDRYGLSDRWAYMHYKGGFFGLPSEKVRDLYRTADLWLNISGATYPREEHLGIPKRAYLDTDPAFMQITVATGDPDKTWGIHAHNVHLTFAENIGRPGCTVPDDGIRWQPCRQPVHLPLWEPAYTPHAEAFTTVTNYTAYKPLEFRGETYGQKDLEFRRFIDLPCRTPQTMEVALVAVEEVKAMFREHGWRLRDPVAVTKDVDSYQAYIAGSRAEWSVAKNAYVRTNSGHGANRTDVFAIPTRSLASLAAAPGTARTLRAASAMDRPSPEFRQRVHENIGRAMERRVPGWSGWFAHPPR